MPSFGTDDAGKFRQTKQVPVVVGRQHIIIEPSPFCYYGITMAATKALPCLEVVVKEEEEEEGSGTRRHFNHHPPSPFVHDI